MLNFLKELHKNDQGQALVLVALAMVVLLGFSAIAIDYGYLAWQKRSLQNAADSAALAAAWELPDDSKVKSKAREYAKSNASELVDDGITATMENGNNEVKVNVEHTYNTFLGGVLGSKEQTISATATAKKLPNWAGESLPFMNIAFDYEDYTGDNFMSWTHQAPGNMGTIMNFHTRNQGTDHEYFEIDHNNGVQLTMGFANGTKGIDGSKLSETLEAVMSTDDIGRKFYIFSLKPSVIEDEEVEVISDPQGREETRTLDDIKNGDYIIKQDQLVLIEVILKGFDDSNQHNIQLTYTGNSYNLEDEFPTEHLNSPGGSSRLIN